MMDEKRKAYYEAMKRGFFDDKEVKEIVRMAHLPSQKEQLSELRQDIQEMKKLLQEMINRGNDRTSA